MNPTRIDRCENKKKKGEKHDEDAGRRPLFFPETTTTLEFSENLLEN